MPDLENPQDLKTCNALLRTRFLDRKKRVSELDSLVKDHKARRELQEWHRIYQEEKANIKGRLDVLDDEMNRLAALGTQLDMGLNI